MISDLPDLNHDFTMNIPLTKAFWTSSFLLLALATPLFAADEAADSQRELAMQPLPDRFTNSLGMVFVKVPGASVMFSIWDTRVQDYRAYVADNPDSDIDGGWKDPGFKQGETHPVVTVNWVDARAFCRWLSRKEGRKYRLSMDAEWSVAVGLQEESGSTPGEKSAKIKGVYPWGTQWPPPDNAGNYDDYSPMAIPGFQDNFDRTSPVGSFKANRFGLYDMGGNVWQWCEDWYDGQQTSRGLRGGSWRDVGPDFLLSSFRFNRTPDYRGNDDGFRCVLVGGLSR